MPSSSPGHSWWWGVWLSIWAGPCAVPRWLWGQEPCRSAPHTDTKGRGERAALSLPVSTPARHCTPDPGQGSAPQAWSEKG